MTCAEKDTHLAVTSAPMSGADRGQSAAPAAVYLTAMLYGVGFPPGFQLQGDGPLLLGSVVLSISWPLDPNPCCHIYFAFQAESWRPNILFYIDQLGNGHQSRSILALACCSAVVRAEELDGQCDKISR